MGKFDMKETREMFENFINAFNGCYSEYSINYKYIPKYQLDIIIEFMNKYDKCKSNGDDIYI